LDQIRIRAHELWESEGRPHGRDHDHWVKAEQELDAAAPNGAQRNEGEGNRTAARQYNADTQQFVATGEVPKQAREAAEALDGPEGEALRQAEEIGKRGEPREQAKRQQA
jgi:hypothetical protein